MLNLLLKTLPCYRDYLIFFLYFFVLHLFIFSSSRPLFSCVLLFKRSSVMRFFDLYTFVFRSFVSATFCPALIKGALLSLHLHKYPSSHPFYMVFINLICLHLFVAFLRSFAITESYNLIFSII